MLEKIIKNAERIILAISLAAVSTFYSGVNADTYLKENPSAKTPKTKEHNLLFIDPSGKNGWENAEIELKTARDDKKKEMYLDIKLKNSPQLQITYYLHFPPYVTLDNLALKSKPAKTEVWEDYIPLMRLQKKKTELPEAQQFVKGEAEHYIFGETIGQIPLAGLLLRIENFAKDIELKEISGSFPDIVTKKVCTFSTYTEDELSLKFDAEVKHKELKVGTEKGEVIYATYPPKNTPAEVFATLSFALRDSNLTLDSKTSQVTLNFQEIGEIAQISLESFLLGKYEMPRGFELAKDEDTIKKMKDSGLDGNPSSIKKDSLPDGLKRGFASVYKGDEEQNNEFKTLTVFVLESQKDDALRKGKSFATTPKTEQILYSVEDGHLTVKAVYIRKPEHSEEQLNDTSEGFKKFIIRMNRQNNIDLTLQKE